MIDREKMIEEIEKVLQLEQMKIANTTEEFAKLQKIGITRCNAEALYNAGCLKISEDMVVLTREEYERLASYISEERAREIFHEETEKLKEKIRKETAVKILSELREFVENRKHRFDLECKAAEETAKSYDKNDYGNEVFTKILHKKDGAWCECDIIELKIDNLEKKYGVEDK